MLTLHKVYGIMNEDNKDIVLEYLEKEIKKVGISIERVKTKRNATEKEREDLRKKMGILNVLKSVYLRSLQEERSKKNGNEG